MDLTIRTYFGVQNGIDLTNLQAGSKYAKHEPSIPEYPKVFFIQCMSISKSIFYICFPFQFLIYLEQKGPVTRCFGAFQLISKGSERSGFIQSRYSYYTPEN